MKTVAIIPARMDSKRLPSKHLLSMNGQAMLYYLVERMRWTPGMDAVVLATTSRSLDDPLVDWARKLDIGVFRGDSEDVLGRMNSASVEFGADLVVKANGDNPLLAPEVIIAGLSQMAETDWEFLTAKGAYTGLPIGLGVEIIRSDVLERISREAGNQFHRENVTTWIFENLERFKWAPITTQESWVGPDISLTVDTLEDFNWVSSVVKKLDGRLPQEWTIEQIIASCRAQSSSKQESNVGGLN